MAQQQSSAPERANPQEPSLRRLAFVQHATQYTVDSTWHLSQSFYQTLRTYVPRALEPQVAGIEHKASEIASYGAPVVNSVQDRSAQALAVADKQVDGIVKRANDFYSANSTYLSKAVEKQSNYHAKNLQHFKEARDAYLQQAKEAVNFLKREGVSGAARQAVDGLLARVEQAKAVPSYLSHQANLLLEKVTVAWNQVSQYPAVQKTLQAVSPAVEQAKKRYVEAHDIVVTAPVYNKAVDTGADVLKKAQTTYVYKTAANRLYPLVGPYADPVIDKVSQSPYVNGVLDHLKPQHTVGAAA